MMTRFTFLMAAALESLLPSAVRAEPAALPGPGFPASHYETLWTKSPFAVATSEAAPESADYTLVGIAEFDGVPYASLVDKQSQEHFLLSGDKPIRGLTLLSITRGHDGSDTTAVVQRNGESLTLKLTSVASPAASTQVGSTIVPPQIPMPGAGLSGQATAGMPGFSGVPPAAPFHRRVIHFPPNPNQPESGTPAINRAQQPGQFFPAPASANP
jgi:hypothetical protein